MRSPFLIGFPENPLIVQFTTPIGPVDTEFQTIAYSFVKGETPKRGSSDGRRNPLACWHEKVGGERVVPVSAGSRFCGIAVCSCSFFVVKRGLAVPGTPGSVLLLLDDRRCLHGSQANPDIPGFVGFRREGAFGDEPAVGA